MDSDEELGEADNSGAELADEGSDIFDTDSSDDQENVAVG